MMTNKTPNTDLEKKLLHLLVKKLGGHGVWLHNGPLKEIKFDDPMNGFSVGKGRSVRMSDIIDLVCNELRYADPTIDRRPVGVNDKFGTPIFEGDRVRYNLEGAHTRPDYWNPEYIVVYEPPAFTLKWVGGGKDGGSHDFMLKHGGNNGSLEIVFLEKPDVQQ